MAKSSKKQCRTPKPPRQGGGLVVVSQRNLSRVAKPEPSKATKKAKGKKRKIASNPLRELMASGDGDESADFAPLPTGVAGAGGITQFMFSSAHHSREQRLYYLLATRPAPPRLSSSAGDQEQLSEGGSTGDASGGAGATVEGGCHALVFVETTTAAQELVGELKALSLVAFALHERTPKAQVTTAVQNNLNKPLSRIRGTPEYIIFALSLHVCCWMQVCPARQTAVARRHLAVRRYSAVPVHTAGLRSISSPES